MSSEFIFQVGQGIVYAILMYRQNGHLAEANRLMREHHGISAQSQGFQWDRVRHYWPLMAMAVLAIVGWIPYWLSKPTSTEIVIVSQEHFRPSDTKYGSGLRLTIATDHSRAESVQLLVICDGPIGLAPIVGYSSKSGQFALESQMLMASHAEVWNAKWRPEEWKPDDRITFEFLSRNPVEAKWVMPINYNPNQ